MLNKINLNYTSSASIIIITLIKSKKNNPNKDINITNLESLKYS